MMFFCKRDDIFVEELARDLDLAMKREGEAVCLYTKRGGQFVDAIYKDPIDIVTIPDEPCFAHIARRARSLSYLVEYHNPAPERGPSIH